jgi:hypothetical protein
VATKCGGQPGPRPGSGARRKHVLPRSTRPWRARHRLRGPVPGAPLRRRHAGGRNGGRLRRGGAEQARYIGVSNYQASGSHGRWAGARRWGTAWSLCSRATTCCSARSSEFCQRRRGLAVILQPALAAAYSPASTPAPPPAEGALHARHRGHDVRSAVLERPRFAIVDVVALAKEHGSPHRSPSPGLATGRHAPLVGAWPEQLQASIAAVDFRSTRRSGAPRRSRTSTAGDAAR